MIGKAVIKQLVTSQLDSRGYVLKEKAAPPRGFRSFLEVYNRRIGPPRTVFDIGVGRGTKWLYDSFPDADLVLVEPLDRFEPKIQEILNTRKAVWHRCALSDAAGEITMLIPRRVPTGASILGRHKDWRELTANQRDTDVIEQTVPMKTLDEIAKGAEPPFVIKMDVEGAEVKVLQGGAEAIRSASLVIVEASVGPRHAGECDLIDIGSLLKPFGFKLAEIIDMAAYGPDKLLNYLDAAFVRADSGFWRDTPFKG
jgi:FkbM family methyltransferase